MNNSIGIIGGADGPTAIFVFGDLRPLIIGIVVAAVVIIAAIIIIKKRKK